MKKLIPIFVLISVALLVTLVFLEESDRPDLKKPVTLTVWHIFVEDMRSVFDEVLNEFNNSVGAENGITVKATSVTDAGVINENLVAAANSDPGAPKLPDMVVVNPRVAITLSEKGKLVDLTQYFSQDELDTFVPQFIEEGRLETTKLYTLPIAKSTEVLYVNRTLFNRFSSETGIGLDKLSTFEGIAEAAVKYYKWVDAMTPQIPYDGKLFFYPEGLFNQAMIGFQQLGGDIVKDKKLNLSTSIFKRIWECFYIPAVQGGVAIYSGYANYLAATGDVICTTASSAGSFFYPSQITYTDNTKEDVEFDVLPFPVFEGGDKVAFQRGGGICVTKSKPETEYAACLFLKWFTEPERNLRFCSSTGYIPVRKSAYDRIMAKDFPAIANKTAEKALLVVAEMQKSHRFYFPPVFDGFDYLQSQYADRLRQAARDGRNEYLRLLRTSDAEKAFNSATKNAMERFIKMFNQ